MKLWRKDGGQDSNVWGLYLPEIKKLFSVVLLRFQGACRESFHDHAFNSIAWVLKGELIEECLNGQIKVYTPSLWPFFVSRHRFHRVSSNSTSWVLNLRGPWLNTWHEYIGGKFITLTHGRQVVG